MNKEENLLNILYDLEEGDKVILINADGLIIGLEKIFCLNSEHIAVAFFGAEVGKLYNNDYIQDSDIIEDLKNNFEVVDFSIVDEEDI